MRQIEKKLFTLIERAKELGLSDKDALAANEFVENREYELAFDTVVTQMYEFDIFIDRSFYEMISDVVTSLELQPGNFYYIAELVR